MLKIPPVGDGGSGGSNVCVCVYVCMCARMHVYWYVCMRVNIHVCRDQSLFNHYPLHGLRQDDGPILELINSAKLTGP